MVACAFSCIGFRVRLMKYLTLILLLSACATYKPPTYKSKYVDEAIKTFSTLFRLEVKIDVAVVDKFSYKMPDNVVGVCYYFPRHIELLKSHIVDFPEFTEQLVFHELAHCAMDLNHDNTRLTIMNSVLLPSQTYQDNRELLIQDLYNRCKYISGICK